MEALTIGGSRSTKFISFGMNSIKCISRHQVQCHQENP